MSRLVDRLWSLGYRVTVVLLCAFILAPIFIVIYASLLPSVIVTVPPTGLSLEWYAKLLQHPELGQSLVLSLEVGLITAVICLVLTVPAAIAISRRRFPGRGLVEIILTSPLAVPTLIIGLALLQFYSSIGLFDTFVGLVVAHVLVSMPYCLRPVMAALSNYDASVEEAAAVLGAHPWTILRRVTLPIIRPGLVAGAMFAFIISFDQFTVTLFVVAANYVTLPIQIFNYVSYQNDPTIAALSTLLILGALVLIFGVEGTVGLDQLGQAE
ncbi:MAG: ABC transporter permease [Chloroflexi bacterium]|nr:ABC transporter permease [Chloroflexota bacterium]